MANFTLNVNGKNYQVEAPGDMPVLWVLRDRLQLTGSKYGCGVGVCGACSILLNGKATKSCQLELKDVGKQKIVTIEGLSPNGDHPLQRAWMDADVPQCGYCQSGQIIAAAALLKAKPRPTDAEITEAMKGNYCRCGTYERIRVAIHAAAGQGGSK